MHAERLQLQDYVLLIEFNPFTLSELISIKVSSQNQDIIVHASLYKRSRTMIHEENLVWYVAKFSQLWLASMYTWMSKVLSVFTQTGDRTSRQTDLTRNERRPCSVRISMAEIRRGLNLCRTSFIFIFGIVRLQTKHVSKLRSEYYIHSNIHVRICTIKVQP